MEETVTYSGLVLVACSGLLVSLGTILSLLSMMAFFRMSFYFWTTDLNIELGEGALIMSGAALCLPICWLTSVVTSYPRRITVHAALMALVIAALTLLATGMMSLMSLAHSLRDPVALNKSLYSALNREPRDPIVRAAFNDMQLELACCGVMSHSDWYKHRRVLPAACCGISPKSEQEDVCNLPKFTTGCLVNSLVQLRYYCTYNSVIGHALILVLVVTLCTSAYILVSAMIDDEKTHPLKNTRSILLTCLTPNINFSPLAGTIELPVQHLSMTPTVV